MIIKFSNSTKLKKHTKAWQTFHRVEGPGKTLLNLLKLFPFSAKKNKLIKFNSNFELHHFIIIDYKKKILNYKKLIKKIKKKNLFKVKKTRFRALNKYFKLLIFLVNFLSFSFYNLMQNLFYENDDYNTINDNTNILQSVLTAKKKRKKVIFSNNFITDNDYIYNDELFNCSLSEENKNYLNFIKKTNNLNKNVDFYILMNNGLLELIGHYNDSILLKLKKKILLYYYNFFGMDSQLNSLSKKLKYLKTGGDDFFNSKKFKIFYKFIKFVDFFKNIHSTFGIGIKNKHFNKLNISFNKQHKFVLINNKYNSYNNNLLPFYNVSTNNFNNNNIQYNYLLLNNFFVNNIEDINFCENLFYDNYFFFNNFINFLGNNDFVLENNTNSIFYLYTNNTNLFNNCNNNSAIESFSLNYKSFINLFDICWLNLDFSYFNNNSWFIYTSFYAKNFYLIMDELAFGMDKYRNYNEVLVDKWYSKISDFMIIYERFRFFNRLYMQDKLAKLHKSVLVFYRIYFYKYLYNLMNRWKLISSLPKKKQRVLTRWLKKIQVFLSNSHHYFFKDVIKNFVWKDHKVLNKVIKSHFSWKAKKFINARQAAGSYYNAINTFYQENLIALKLRVATSDLFYDNFLILDDLLLEFKLLNKNDKITDKRKKKISLNAKKFYEILNRKREERGIFYCKYARTFYNLNNKKSISKYLAKLSKLLIPLKTYNRLYALFELNHKNYKEFISFKNNI